jgi:hypothetical protein
MKNKSALLTGFAILSWLTASIIGYIYLHKPFAPEQAIQWLTFCWQIMLTGIIVSVAGGIGHRILKNIIGIETISTAVLHVALGLGFLATLVLVVGTITLNLYLLATIIVLMAIILRVEIFGWIAQWRNLIDYKPHGIFFTVITAIIAVIVLMAFFTALSPPIRFDALTYHLSLPKAYLLDGRIGYLPENIFWGMPQLTEMIFMIGIAFAGPETAALLGWAIGLFAFLGILDYTTRHFSRGAGWVAIAAVLSGETFASALSWGYVDWAVILFGFAFIVSIERWSITYKNTDIILAAIFAGLAVSTKYTAGILLITGIGIILISKQTIYMKFKFLLTFLGVATIMVSPWLIKNIIATGNPIYPLIIPAGEMDSLRIYKYHFSPATTNWWRIITLPWDMTVWGVEGGVGYGASIGPLLLGLSPLAFLNWNKKNDAQKNIIKISSIILLQCFLFVAIGSQFVGLLNQTRLFFALFPAWAFMAGAGFDAALQVNAKEVRFSKIIPILVLLPLVFTLLQLSIEFNARDIPSFLFQKISKDKYTEHNLGAYQKAIKAINLLPQNNKILMLWETRSFSCLPNCDGDEIIDRWYHDWRTIGNSQKILEYWQGEGYTYLLYNRIGSDFIRETEKRKYTPKDWEGLDEMLKFLGEPTQIIDNQYILYDIRRSDNR